MSERNLGEGEFELATNAANAVMGCDQPLPSHLADKAEQFVKNNSYFSGLVEVERSGDDVTLVRSVERELEPDFRFGESVSSEVRRNRMTASGHKVVGKFNNK